MAPKNRAFLAKYESDPTKKGFSASPRPSRPTIVNSSDFCKAKVWFFVESVTPGIWRWLTFASGRAVVSCLCTRLSNVACQTTNLVLRLGILLALRSTPPDKAISFNHYPTAASGLSAYRCLT